MKKKIKKQKPLWLLTVIGLLPLIFFIFFKISISAVLVLGVIYAAVAFFLLGPEMIVNAFLVIVFGLVSHSNPYNYIEEFIKIVRPEKGLTYEQAFALQTRKPFTVESSIALVDYIGTYSEQSGYSRYEKKYHAIPIINQKNWHKERPVLLWATCMYKTRDACIDSWKNSNGKKLEFYAIYRNQFLRAAEKSIDAYNIAAEPGMRFVRLHKNPEEYWQWVYLVSVFMAWIIGARTVRFYITKRNRNAHER